MTMKPPCIQIQDYRVLSHLQCNKKEGAQLQLKFYKINNILKLLLMEAEQPDKKIIIVIPLLKR